MCSQDIRMDREAELRRLSQADTHIAKAERAVSEQMIEIEQLHLHGHDTALAQATLEQFENTLHVMRSHRNQIVKIIEKIDEGLI